MDYLQFLLILTVCIPLKMFNSWSSLNIKSPVKPSKVKLAKQLHLLDFLSFNLTSGVNGLPLLEQRPKSCLYLLKFRGYSKL